MTVERRLYVHAFVARLYFYVPILLHHMERELVGASAVNPRAISLGLLSLMSLGMIVAQYPSGLFADWLGRKPSIVLSGFVQGVGVLLLLVPASLAALAIGQFLIGVGTAFRNGADSALLHGHLEREGRGGEYGTALARLRFFNVAGIASGSAMGGVLYDFDPRSVFVLAAAAGLIGLLPFIGLREPPVTVSPRRYRDVLRESLAEVRDNRAARSLMILGGLGNPFFVLAFWVTQTFMVDLAFPFVWMGLLSSTMSALQGATMPLSSWLSRSKRLLSRTLIVLVLLPGSAFAVFAVAFRAEHAVLATAILVAANGSHLLYRNAVNVLLQRLVPDTVRSSIVSVEAGIGSVWYAALFPVAGWLLGSLGLADGLLVVAALALATVLPPLLSALRSGVFALR